MPKIATHVLLNFAVAISYAVTGFIGLQVAFVGEVVTLFWPPSGIAFAAVWLGGLRLLPGVVLGAFVVNQTVIGAPSAALAVALGNMLPALVGVIVLRRMIGRDGQMPGELRRVLWFLLVAVLGATMLSAAVGTLAVGMGGASLDSGPASTWVVWWLGDAMGVLIAAPAVLLLVRLRTLRLQLRQVLEALWFALAGGATLAALVLIEDPIWAVELCKLFTLFLSLLAAARFGLAGAAAMTLLMSVGTAGATAAGVGPFLRGDFRDSFALLHSYLFAQAVAALLLAAALEDLRRLVTAERAARGVAETTAANRIHFLAMISHDVRTPLAGMLGALQVLERRPLAEAERRLVGLASRAGRNLSALVDDILDLVRLDRGPIVLRDEAFSPGDALRDTVDLHRAAAAAKGLELRLFGIDRLPATVGGDRTRFEQVIGNLVANAVNFTAAGRVTVSAAWMPDRTRPLRVSVADTGPGIDADLAERIFEPFVQGAPPATGTTRGLGLGLHIVRELVDRMGGRLGLGPADGGGSVFTVKLPLKARSRPAERVPAAALPAASVREPPLTVLLVEDDPIGLEVTAALLRDRGHTVVTAATADEAVRQAEGGRFDLVLTDLHLASAGAGAGEAAGGSGLDAVRRIRALGGRTGDALIVALTADVQAVGLVDDPAARLDGVLVKPLDIEGGLVPLIRDRLASRAEPLPS